MEVYCLFMMRKKEKVITMTVTLILVVILICIKVTHLVIIERPFTFLEISFQKQKSAEESSRKKREESSADFVYRVGSFSAVSFSSAKNISTFF